MLCELTRFCIRVTLSALVGSLLFTQSGLSGFALAAAASCDQTDFTKFFLGPDGVSTYALTKSPLTWQVASTLAIAQGGRLAVITGAPLNSAIFENLSSSFGVAAVTSYPGKKAWIDLVDPNNIPDWSMPGQPAIVVPSRFGWADGTSTFSNWAAGQPDGYCTAAEMTTNPNHICYGEQWATINSDGTWSDEGDHGPTPITLPAVVEWPNSTLDCVSTVTPPSSPITAPLPGSSSGQQWCTNSTQSNLLQCAATSDGGQICPLEQALCDVSQSNPICPTGSILNTNRHMCQATPVSSCGSGYTWDAAIDKCTAAVSCQDGGVFNTLSGRCEKSSSASCLVGFTYNSGTGKCTATPTCSTGAYNAATDRCEATPAYSCTDAGYAVNGTTGRCEAAPTCSQGSYNSTYHVCLQAMSPTCPAGYNQNNGRCEMAPQCSQGTFNPVTNKCESGSNLSYDAQVTGGMVQFDQPFTDDIYGAGDYGSGTPLRYGSQTAFPGSVSDNLLYGVYVSAVQFPGSVIVCTDVYAQADTYLCDAIGYAPTAAGAYPVGTSTYSCPSGGTLNGTTCTNNTLVQTNPTCPSGTMDFGNHVCYAAYTPTCPGSASYDSTIGQCTSAPACGQGLLDTAANVCYESTAPSCGTLSLDSSASVCFSPPVCSPGAYVAADNACEVAPSNGCGSYSWDATAGVCAQPISCPTDPTYPLNSTIAFSSTASACVSDALHTCATGTTYNGLPIEQCEAVPICAAGATYNSLTNTCVSSYSCPTSPANCHQLAGDITMIAPGIPAQYCSANKCQSDTSGWTSINDTPSGQNDKTNDGAHDANGNCLGQIYLFNGNDMRCRQYDLNGMVDSFAKLAGTIALVATGLGASLTGELVAEGFIANAGSAAALTTTALANTAAILALNASLDAATGQASSISLVSAATTLVAQGLATWLAAVPAAQSFTGTINGVSTTTFMNSANDIIGSTINSGALFQPIGTLTQAASNMIANGSFQAYMQGIQEMVGTFAPAISQGMLGAYTPTKCCYPDKLSAGCQSTEIQEASEQHNNMCHIVGSYCSSAFLFACMVKKETSCCFQSQLARIMQEQGRAQLQSFSSGWGTPESPNCRGFTPEEFQSLNFSIMDLSEWEASLSANMNQIQSAVQSFIGSTGTAATQALQNSPAPKGGNP